MFVAFNTLFALTEQDAQIRCFQAVARHLLPGGRFPVEAFVPDLTRFSKGRHTNVVRLSINEVQLDCGLHDARSQRVTTQHVILSEQGTRFCPVEIRYAWPAEMDLMAPPGWAAVGQPLGRLGPRALHRQFVHDGVGLESTVGGLAGVALCRAARGRCQGFANVVPSQ